MLDGSVCASAVDCCPNSQQDSRWNARFKAERPIVFRPCLADATVGDGHQSVVCQLVGGIVGTIAALVGIADHLIDFLIVLGLLVPPIAGVYLCDFFILKRTDFSTARLSNRPALKVNALIAGIGSGLLATWMYYSELSITSIGALDSLLISVVAYLALEKGGAILGQK